MNTLINYLIEANIGLTLMLAMYVIFLSKETDFTVKRVFLLVSIGLSLVLPLIHLESTQTNYVPSLMNILPVTWLPETVIYADGQTAVPTAASVNGWKVAGAVYAIGLTAGILVFLIRLTSLVRVFRHSSTYAVGPCPVFESDNNQSSFSFFRRIFIGQANALSDEEKAMIIRHEMIHAQLHHSFDILLINIVGVFFWFNPVIGIYRRILVQLHEFEADARSVSTREVNTYCSLLAKVALLSADVKLANHFSSPLTVKRIEMMRTIKTKIKRWKYVALATVLPCFFFVIACQEQVVSELTEVARNSTNALLVPPEVQTRYDEIRRANPDVKILLLEMNDEGRDKLEDFERTYGKPSLLEFALEVTDNGDGKQNKNRSSGNDPARSFAIIGYNQSMASIAERAKSDDDIYSAVEEPAQFPGGLDALRTFISENMLYPAVARQQGIEGSTFVSFVVETDGSITNAAVVKGTSLECDMEAKRVVEMFPKWIPGKQSGSIVRSRFVIPIKFKLAAEESRQQSEGN